VRISLTKGVLDRVPEVTDRLEQAIQGLMARPGTV
jgi:hypothetical protein